MDTVCLLFTKAPVPGHVKTRLIPALGAHGAAALQARLLDSTVAAIVGSRFENVELWVAGCLDHPQLAQIKLVHGWACFAQCGDDLGARMAGALGDALGRHSRAILIGSDCLQLSPDYLNQALDSLDSHDCVLGPSSDGGYVLIGMRTLHQALFEQMDWGVDGVFETTCQRLRELGLSWQVLAPVDDIDEPADLERLEKTNLEEYARWLR